MNTFHNLINKGVPSYGVYIGDTGTAVAEIAAVAGFDFMRIDCEHSLNSGTELKNIIRCADAHGLHL